MMESSNLLEEVLLDVAMFVAPLAIYILIIRNLLADSADARLHAYSQPGWNFPLKRAYARLCLWKQGPQTVTQVKHPFPIIPSDQEFRMEKPRKILRNKSMDSMCIFGVDGQGNWLVTKIVRKFHRQAEVWLHLGLADGSVYQLTDHPDSTIATANNKNFHAGDLKFTQIEPMRKWRITFNGTLRKGVTTDWRSLQDEQKMVHVRLNFIWTACSSPCDAREMWSNKLISEAIAREPWRSGNWFTIVGLEPPGYDQFGVLDGLVRIGESDPGTRLYLRGGRERRWGEVQEESLIRSIKLHGVAENGCFFCLRVTCRQDGLTQSVWGIVRLPTGLVASVTYCSLDLADVAHHKNIPRQLLVRFVAAGQNFSTSIQFKDDQGATIYSGYPWKQQTMIRYFEFGMDIVRGDGIAEFTYKYRGVCPVPHVLAVGQLAVNTWEPRVEAGQAHQLLVCGLDEHAAQTEALTGGKGASLALLTSVQDKSYFVPEGFCVTTAAYAKQLASSTLIQASIVNIKEIATCQKDGDLKVACKKASTSFEKTEMNKDIKLAIEIYLNKFSSDTVFAVRSSAVGEDSEDLSCAGQNLTVLGVKSHGVFEAVAKCWGSLFSEHSVQYRRQNGQILDPCMAVVIQKIVAADTAGVMFTRHPFSGNPRQLVITSNYGLGESVVSASVEPDTVIISRSWDDRCVKVQEVKVGSKQGGIVLGPDGEGTESNIPTTQDQEKLCLTQDQMLTLAQVGVALEKMFGGPRDIEWAFVKEQLYMLQARPITALDTWTDFELQHEFDAAITTQNEVNTFANTGEVFPGATTPLTQSILSRLLDYEIQIQCAKRNKMRSPSTQFNSIIGSTSNHIMINVINSLLSNNEQEVSITNKVMDLAVFGHLVTDAKLLKLGIQRFGVMDKITKFKTIYDMLADTITAGKVEKQTQREIKSLSLRAEEHTTSASLFAAITSQLPLLLKASEKHGHMSRVSIFTQVAAMSVLAEGKKEWTTDHYTDISLLLSSCSGVESAEIPTQLRELAITIADEDSQFFTSTSPSQALNWIQTESSVAPKFRSFLLAHGHRSIREFELHTMTWGMQPENLITILQSLVKSPHLPADNETSLSVAEACEILKSPTKEGTRRALRFLLPYCRTAVARRERSKSSLISALHTFRLGCRRLSQLLVKEGRLPDPDLMFYLTHNEISKLIQIPDSLLLSKATRRRRLWSSWENLRYPEIVHGVPKQIQEGDHELIVEGLHKLQATPVCAGVVLGRACVITNFSQTTEIIQGDVLITHSTDIGWSPYFPLLAGIVTELGGLISHGAVIAREYGLPCIVGATNATYMFNTGDLVRLNGGTGMLEKISKDPILTN